MSILDSLQPSVRQFMENNIDIINAKNFKELYKRSEPEHNGDLMGYVFEIAQAFYKIGVDPLKDGVGEGKLNYVPPRYLSFCDIEPKELPEGIKRIGQGAFGANGAIETIKLPKSLTMIESNAFSYSNLKEIVIPQEVVVIDDYAFKGCTLLTKVVIEGYPYINKDVFAGCGRLKKIYLKNRKMASEYKTISGIPTEYI